MYSILPWWLHASLSNIARYLLSHGAIIAREYAIPAVIKVQGAMQRIRDGQTITVDGTSGRVYLDDEAFA